MAKHGSGAVLRQIHTLFTAGSLTGLSDRQLLERFVAHRDAVAELAFATLVERHGPMVLGVCRRILVDPHDADDAFQATFLVLVRQAGWIRVDGSVGRWLYGVATRVAARARADKRHRRQRERSGLNVVGVEVHEAASSAADLAELSSGTEDGAQKARLTLLAPVDGMIHRVDAGPGKIYNIKSVLMEIVPEVIGTVTETRGRPRPGSLTRPRQSRTAS